MKSRIGPLCSETSYLFTRAWAAASACALLRIFAPHIACLGDSIANRFDPRRMSWVCHLRVANAKCGLLIAGNEALQQRRFFSRVSSCQSLLTTVWSQRTLFKVCV